MILSMTGFGKGAATYGTRTITAEVKSLNSKQLDLSSRLPSIYREKDLELRNIVGSALVRGKVDILIYTESDGDANVSELNLPVLKAYKHNLEQMSSQLGIDLPSDWYATLLRLPDVFVTETPGDISDEEHAALIRAVKAATEALVEFRIQEGARLASFFEEKIANLRRLLADVEPLEAERIPKIKARIEEALASLDGVDYDKGRFEQEMIFYIEKLDVNEEKLRLANHLDYFLETLHAPTTGQGKKLGFIAQEMGREINTLGSKSNHAEMQRIVVRMKDELEQIKEQVLNVL